MKISLRLHAVSGILAIVGATTIVLAPTAPAQAATGTVGSPSWMAVGNGVTYENCVEIPYNLKVMSAWADAQALAWGNIYHYYNYDVNLTLIGPDGTVAATDRVIQEADIFSVDGDDSGSFYSCAGPGSYSVRVAGYWCPIDYASSNPSCKNVAFKRAFSMRPASTSPLLSGKKKAKLGKKYKVTAAVRVERSTGFYSASGVSVTLQYKRGKRWVNYGKATTNGAGKAKFKVKFANRGKFQFRVAVKKADFYGASVSRVKKVKVG